jgi:hypothetical protein
MKLQLLLALTTLLPSCFVGVSGGGVHAPDPYIHEWEPNDSAAFANGIGPIFPGDQFLIRGAVTDVGPDFFDGFAFLADQPSDIEFVLSSDDPYADLDLCLFDPYTGQTVACWENPGDESGIFSVHTGGTEFHLVVSSFSGSTFYTLAVRGFPFGYLDTAGASSAAASSGSSLRAATGAAPVRERNRAWSEYGSLGTADTSPRIEVLRQGTLVQVDADTGEVRTRTFAIGSDGTVFLPGKR